MVSGFWNNFLLQMPKDVIFAFGNQDLVQSPVQKFQIIHLLYVLAVLFRESEFFP